MATWLPFTNAPSIPESRSPDESQTFRWMFRVKVMVIVFTEHGNGLDCPAIKDKKLAPRIVKFPVIDNTGKLVQLVLAVTNAVMEFVGIAEFKTAKLTLHGVFKLTVLPCSTVNIRFPPDT